MHHGWTLAAHRDGTRSRQERSLTDATFVGSFPSPDFAITPQLPEIALLGRSNVGKSSLVNALVGRRSLARTSATPGKTQACNVFAIAKSYYLVDLPGYGYARVAKSRQRELRLLLERYVTERASLRGAVWLMDIRRDPSPDDRHIAQLLETRGVPVLVAVTKADKLASSKRMSRAHAILDAVALPRDQCVMTSSRTGEGMDELRQSIANLLTTLEP